MLPFLKPKTAASTIIMHRKASGEKAAEHGETEQHPEMMAHASKLVEAIHSKDHAAAAEALQAIHSHLSKPKEEKAAE